ncbi:MAG: hypothetical protein QM808_00870 [Steroidobacteraceae bacterium]
MNSNIRARHGKWLILSVALFSLAACFAAPNPTAASQSSGVSVGSIIVKPRNQYADGAALMKAINAKLTSPQRLQFLRPMSGSAYVLNVIAPASKDDIPRIISELSATGMFEYVEPDEVVTIQR